MDLARDQMMDENERFTDLLEKAEQERDQLKAENAELRRDAERYRWLRKCSHFDMPQHRVFCGAYGPALDEDIDQAMTKEQP